MSEVPSKRMCSSSRSLSFCPDDLSSSPLSFLVTGTTHIFALTLQLRNIGNEITEKEAWHLSCTLKQINIFQNLYKDPSLYHPEAAEVLPGWFILLPKMKQLANCRCLSKRHDSCRVLQRTTDCLAKGWIFYLGRRVISICFLYLRELQQTEVL